MCFGPSRSTHSSTTARVSARSATTGGELSAGQLHLRFAGDGTAPAMLLLHDAPGSSEQAEALIRDNPTLFFSYSAPKSDEFEAVLYEIAGKAVQIGTVQIEAIEQAAAPQTPAPKVTPSSLPRAGYAISPVDGEEVQIEGALHYADHGGTRYYFTCPNCKRRFLKSPGTYLNPVAPDPATPNPAVNA